MLYDQARPWCPTTKHSHLRWAFHFCPWWAVMLYSGEFHPFRLTVPWLWLDIFQKVKAAGFNAFSCYTDGWEVSQASFGRIGSRFHSGTRLCVWAFLRCYQCSRPPSYRKTGPYINAEVSGDGFPGWIQWVKAIMRRADYVPYTENYVNKIGAIIQRLK